MARVQVIGHVPFEGLGTIADWFADRAWPVAWTKVWEAGSDQGSVFPRPESFDWLVVMGGPMSVYDEADLPWLRAEKACIRSAIDAGKTVLGVCLGSQFLAEVLGARVFPHNRKEIGWFPLLKVDQPSNATWPPFARALAAAIPPQFTAFHWHGDTFDLPGGVGHLLSSAVCSAQAFVAGAGLGLPIGSQARVLGLQFHLEMNRPALEAMIEAGREEIEGLVAKNNGLTSDRQHAVMSPRAIADQAGQYLQSTQQVLSRILSVLAG